MNQREFYDALYRALIEGVEVETPNGSFIIRVPKIAVMTNTTAAITPVRLAVYSPADKTFLHEVEAKGLDDLSVSDYQKLTVAGKKLSLRRIGQLLRDQGFYRYMKRSDNNRTYYQRVSQESDIKNESNEN